MNFFKKGAYFIKENPKILYSVALVILIPLALFYNTFFSISAFQKNIDFTLQSNALLVESILGNFISDFSSDFGSLQKKIAKVTQDNPEISKLWVAFPENDKLKIVASKKTDEVGQEIKGAPLALAWVKNQAIAYPSVNEQGERFWEVIKPFEDSAGNKVAMVGMSMSLKSIDNLTKQTIYGAYFVVTIIMLLAVFLIIHHTQLFGYVILYRRLREIDRAKDDFIRMATHELQTPIANIRGYVETLKEELGDKVNSEHKEFLARISISAKNLSDLIFDILEVSRLEQDQLDFTPQVVSPVQVVKETIENLRLRASGKNLELVFLGEDLPDTIFANPQRLSQVLVNLIENSIKYTSSGRIEAGVIVDKAGKRVGIFVKDSGLGISAEAQKGLFERFYRVKTAQTAGIPGTGLGLWITKQLCEKMGGAIFMESMEGAGSKVTIVFPLFG